MDAITLAHHPTLPPSSYPAWAQCPHWERAESKELAEAAAIGTQQHELLHKAFCMEVNLDDVDAPSDVLYPVRRAYNGIKRLIENTFGGGHHRPPMSEVKVGSVKLPYEPFGTADVVVSGSERLFVLDYKSRQTEKSHWEQLAFYATALLEAGGGAENLNVKLVTLAVWYGDEGTVDMKEMTPEAALALCLHAIANRLNKDNLPRKAGTWCPLCKQCGACPDSVSIIHQSQSFLPTTVEGNIPENLIPALLTVGTEVKKRLVALGEWARAVAVRNGGYLIDAEGNRAYELKPVRRSELDIQKFYDATRAVLKPNEVLTACKLTKEKARALLYKRPKKDGGHYTMREADAIIAEASTPIDDAAKLVRVKRAAELPAQ